MTNPRGRPPTAGGERDPQPGAAAPGTPPRCAGDRCTECTPDQECCEATCGCCPLVAEQDLCWLSDGSEDGGRYCSQHGEGWLYDRSPEAELRYQVIRNA